MMTIPSVEHNMVEQVETHNIEIIHNASEGLPRSNHSFT